MRIKNVQLSTKKFYMLVLISLFIVHSLLLIPSAYALDSSKSAEVKSKLEQLKADIASRAAELKQEISTKLQNKSYIGSVKTISPNSLTLASLTGPKIVNINQDTIYENETSKLKYSFKNVEEEDYVAALGDVDETGVLTARKIILMPKQTTKKNVLWGQITTLGNNLMIKTKDSKNVKILLQDETTFQKGAEEILIDNVKLNDFVVVVSDENTQGVLTANFVYVIPQGGIIKPKKIATPSAQEATKSTKESTKSGTKN